MTYTYPDVENDFNAIHQKLVKSYGLHKKVNPKSQWSYQQWLEVCLYHDEQILKGYKGFSDLRMGL